MNHSHYHAYRIDRWIIAFAQQNAASVARASIALVFIWFGALKVFDVSPATDLVRVLFEHTIPFLSFETFFLFFGVLEIVIGSMFLVRGWERFATLLLCFHLFTTFLPLVLVPGATWHAFMVPTLEGQYIIKNLIIIAAALGILSHLHQKTSRRK